jgi:hypothetical protein
MRAGKREKGKNNRQNEYYQTTLYKCMEIHNEIPKFA